MHAWGHKHEQLTHSVVIMCGDISLDVQAGCRKILQENFAGGYFLSSRFLWSARDSVKEGVSLGEACNAQQIRGVRRPLANVAGVQPHVAHYA